MSACLRFVFWLSNDFESFEHVELLYRASTVDEITNGCGGRGACMRRWSANLMTLSLNNRA